MEKCQNKDRLYNTVTKRCYKSCEQKKKDTHPVTKKCRKRCQSDKIRRVNDFRCVKKTLKMGTNKMYAKKARTPTPKAKAPTPTPKPDAKAQEELVPPPLQKELQKNFQFLHDLIEKGQGKTVSYDGDMVSEFITVYFHEKYKQHCPMFPIKTYSPFDTEDYKELYKKHKKLYTSTA